MLLFTGARVLAPEDLGVVDVLVEGEEILGIGHYDAREFEAVPGFEALDVSGLTLCPGFIDPHVHFIGGGGEGGFENRTPGITAADCAKYGVTTAVGLLGTDGVSRTTVDLLAAARGLEAQGLSTYIYTGNYRVPVATVTDSVVSDLVIVDKIIGVGEVAIADNRSSCPTTDQLAQLVSDAHVGGLLTGKAGVVHFHVGKERAKLSQLHSLVDEYDVPAQALYATHVARNDELLEDAAALSKKGAYVDITADADTAVNVEKFAQLGGDLSRLTISSDSNGSLPTFDDAGVLTGIGVAHQDFLYQQVWRAAAGVIGENAAVKLVTENTARALALESKGKIAEGKDADLLLVDGQRKLVHMLARGNFLLRNGISQVKGAFDA